MRTIHKGNPPQELLTWIRNHPHGVYSDLDKTSEGREVRRAIRCAAIAEQHCLCAYCCTRIDGSASHNEHIAAQSMAPNHTIDFTNIVASCNSRNQCGDAHGNQMLPLTPLDPACETELRFFISGAVQGMTTNATETIRVLNLNGRGPCGVRKSMVDALIYGAGESPTGLSLLDDDLLGILANELKQVDVDGCLLPYAPILSNIIHQLLTA